MDEILHLKMGYATLEMKNKSRFILCFSLFIVTLHTEIRILFILCNYGKKSSLDDSRWMGNRTAW